MDDALIAAILSRGSLALSDAERAALAADARPMALRLLGADAFNRGDHAAALAALTRVADLPDATPEDEGNLISALMRAGALQEARNRATRPGSPLPSLMRASRLSEIAARAGDAATAISWGRRALKLKDAEAGPTPATPRGPLQVIALSLWGRDPRYLQGAIRNAIVARQLYPGWQLRIYTDDSLPADTLARLQAEGATVARVGGLPAARYGLYWRFLVEDEPAVAAYVIRDADSVMTIAERVAMQQWLDSGLPFHVMRDWLSHSELVLAGMWGARGGHIGDMTGRVRRFVGAGAATQNNRTGDQQFLRHVVWPLMRGRACVHDPVFRYGATHALPPGYALPPGRHIGQNDAVIRAERRTE